uniref:Uncharacterized protein n=1 Tax=candidate division WOR-3 bacterium TaxID=2052148 RepID=A0A7V3ZTS6_UNCW3
MLENLLLLFLIFFPNEKLIRGRDYFQEIKVSRFLLKDTTFYFDLDGDKKKDTLLLYFYQTEYQLEVRSHKSKKIILFIEEAPYASAEYYIEIGRAFLVNDEKPLLIIAIEKFPALGNEFYIYDIIHTAKGIKAEPLLVDKDAGWGNSPIILKPGYVEIRHFRDWLIAKYVWDGEQFKKIYDVNWEK